ncbi:CHAT domain-containing protein [Desulfobacterales bacterium HSG2]|nr:CHAT domain-containing protein [Desulfobacterales bacterium HSG2]
MTKKTTILITLLTLFILPRVSAQVTLDGTIGPMGNMSLPGPHYDIRAEYGEQAGPNLFHSFQTFDINTGESATFKGPGSVRNIISRITGGNTSLIDGTLRSVIPGADLYLLNPAGIMFGANAALDVRGAFHASTADYLRMGESERFYAMPMESEVLSVSSPAAFGFLTLPEEIGETPGEIAFEGCDIEFSGDTLGAVGRNIRITGADMTNSNGRVSLAALSSGEISTDIADSDLSDLTDPGNVAITANQEETPSNIYVRHGSIHIRAGKFLADQSGILADSPFTMESFPASHSDIQAESIKIRNSRLSTDTFGKTEGTSLNILASGSLDISDSNIRSGTIGSTASGNAGTLYISGKDVVISDNTLIQTESKEGASGKAGNVIIHAAESVTMSHAAIDTFTTGAGKAGNVEITANRLSVEEGGSVQAQTQGKGQAGDIRISADTLSLSADASVDTETLGQGNAGNIYIEGNILLLRDNATVSSSSLPSDSEASENRGDAGTINVDATDSLKLSDASSLTTEAEGAGGGRINITAENEIYLLGGEITSSVTRGEGQGGDVTTDSKFVILNHGRITAKADEGDGGAIFITTDNYVKSSDSVVDASSRRGNDGTVRIEAPDVDITSSMALMTGAYLDAGKWAKTPCKARFAEDTSRFVMKGRDAAPPRFDDFLPSLPPESDEYLHRGDFSGAVRASEGKALGVSDALRLAHAYAALGYHGRSLALLRDILPLAEDTDDPSDMAPVLSALADLRLCLGEKKQAIDDVKKGLEYARLTQNSLLIAGVLNHLGNIRAVNRDYRGAVAAYREQIPFLGDSEEALSLKSKLLLNMARAELESGKPRNASAVLEDAATEIGKQPDSYHKAFHLIALSLLLQRTSPLPNPSEAWLGDAARIGEKINNSRITSSAYGFLGEYYEKNDRHDDAVKSTRKAIFLAHQGYFPEILYLWQWQLGRLFGKSGDREGAVASYRNAVGTLNPIRTEFFAGFRGPRDAFGEDVRPVYIGLADLLLEGAGASQILLGETRDAMEFLKKAELENFFRDECLIVREKSGKAEHVPPGTAVIYPILLPDHLHLLLMLPDGMKQISVPADSEQLRTVSKRFRRKLEEMEDDFQDEAAQLYDWLIRPAESEFVSRNTDTLIIAPEGPLCLIPFSALHDGERFLIEKYALGTVPALNLTDIGGIREESGDTLLGGLSQAKEGFLPLKSVKKELHAIRAITGGKVLLDQEFTIENLEAEVRNRNYTTLHIASHAVFGGTRENTFLVTYSGRLTTDGLERLAGLRKYQEEEPELLALSACETAMGDERAAFGLAGVALKAGARSALATLWPVDDQATFLAVSEFYRQMKKSVPKAKALQSAQKKLINGSEYDHPAFWAPFLLIGNWL